MKPGAWPLINNGLNTEGPQLIFSELIPMDAGPAFNRTLELPQNNLL